MKNKKIVFTVNGTTKELWETITKDLIDRRIFKSKADIFESLIHFLNRANHNDVRSFVEKGIYKNENTDISVNNY